MKVLMISTDRKIFEEGSEARLRMKDYGVLFDELHIIVFAQKKLNLGSEQIKNNVWIYPTNSRNRFFYILDAIKKGEELLKSREDWIVSSQDPFETGLVGWWLAFYFRLRLQVQIHTDLYSPYFIKSSFLNRLRVLVAGFIIPRADCLRVVSERIKRSLSNLPLKHEPTILPILTEAYENNSAEGQSIVDLKTLYPEFNFITLIISRLEPEKNISLALEAFGEASKQAQDLGLVILGSGSQESKLQMKVEELGLQDKVKFLGWKENPSAYYKSADLFLLTSNFEGYCRTLVAATLEHLPVLTTNVGLVGEVFVSDNSLICEVGDKECLSRQLSRAAKGEVSLPELAEKALEAVKAKTISNKKDYLRKYLEALNCCLAGE